MKALPFTGLLHKAVRLGDRRSLATVPSPISTPYIPYMPEFAEGTLSQATADQMVAKSWALLESGQTRRRVHRPFLETLHRRANQSMRASVAYPLEFKITNA